MSTDVLGSQELEQWLAEAEATLAELRKSIRRPPVGQQRRLHDQLGQVQDSIDKARGTLKEQAKQQAAVPASAADTASDESVQRDSKKPTHRQPEERITEARYRSLVETAPVVILCLSEDHHILEFNPEAERLYSVKREEVLGCDYLDLFIPASEHAAIAADIRNVLIGKRTRGFVNPITTSDGNERLILWNVERLADATGAASSVICIGLDITERRKAETALRRAEERYALAQKAAHIGTWDWNILTDELVWSEQIEPLFGFAKGEFDGTYEAFMACVHPDDRAHVGAAVEAAVAQNKTYNIEHRILWPDGTVRWVSERGDVFRDSEGRATRMLGVARDITDRKQTEAALRELAQFNEEIIHSAKEGILVCGPDMRFTRWNPAMEEISGMKEDQVVGKHPLDVFPFLAEQGVYALFERAMAGESVSTHDYPYQVPDSDRTGWAHNQYVPLRNTEGQIVGILGTVHDITERKRAEGEVRKLATAVQYSVELVNLATLDGTMTFLNEAGAKMLGIRPDEVTRTNIMEVIPDHLKDRVEKELLPALAGGGTWEGDIEYRNLTTGQLVAVHAMTFTVKDPETGEPLYLANVSHDITDRKQAEEELRQSEEKLQTLFQGVTDAIFVHEFTDDKRPGRIIEVNEHAAAYLGYSRDELLEMSIDDVDDSETTVNVAPIVEKLIAGEDVLFEQWHRAKDGRRIPVEIHVQAFEMAGRPVALSLVRDITDRKRAEEEREQLEAQLRQSQKMEAVGQLAGGVAHDFNNILTAIFGNVELANLALDSEPNPNPRLVESLHQIRQSSRRAAALTRQLLAFSRRQISQPQALDLNHTLTEMEKMLGRLITENITLHLTLAPDLRTTLADPGQIEQIVMNLVVNARDAMPDGGRLTIETRNVMLDARFIASCPELSVGDYVVLAIGDTGTGMDEATAERIFEPFFTTKAIGSGTGLGLAMVYGIVHQAGGHVTVNSRLGHGTTFTLYLPAVDQVAEEKRAQAIAEPAPTGTETILLCEDNDPVRELTGNMLRGAGYTVLMARHGRDAIEIASSHAGPIHLLVTDVIMPDMHGKAVAEELGARWPALKVLFISGYPSNVIAHHGVLNDGVEFLEKPFTRHSLLTRVREVLTA